MPEAELPEPVLGPDITTSEIQRDYSRTTTLLDYIGRALLFLGVPAFRVESALSLFAQRMGANAQVMATPTVVMVTLRKSNDEHTFLIRENPGPPNLGKMAQLADVTNGLADGALPAAEACRQAVEIYRAPSGLKWPLTLLAFVGSSATACLLIGGGWKEMLLAAQLGVVAAIISLLAQRFEPIGRLQVPLAATTISFLANFYCSWQINVSWIEPVVAGLITLLPGLAITTATRELATAHMLAGTTRMSGALVNLLALVFGIGIGAALSDLLVQEPFLVNARPVPDWMLFVLAPLMGLSLAIRFQAQLRDWPIIMITSLATLGALKVQQNFSDPAVGALISATLIGILGNLYAHFTNRPGTIVHLPALLLLVPGSLSLLSIADLMLDDVVTGLEGLVSAMLVAMALATGLVLASVVMPPRRDL